MLFDLLKEDNKLPWIITVRTTVRNFHPETETSLMNSISVQVATKSFEVLRHNSLILRIFFGIKGCYATYFTLKDA